MTPPSLDSQVEATLAWLRPRLEGVPAELSAEIDLCVQSAVSPGALPQPTPGVVAETLAASALAAFDRVLRAPQTRGSATQLLAADACLTYAFESAAEGCGDLAGLSGFAERLGLQGELGTRLQAALADNNGPA